MKSKKKSLGGQLLAAGAGFIPGAGAFISPLISSLDEQMSQKQLPPAPIQKNIPNLNIFGNFELGGPIPIPMARESTLVKSPIIPDLSAPLPEAPISAAEMKIDTMHNSPLTQQRAQANWAAKAPTQPGYVQSSTNPNYEKRTGYGSSNKAKSVDRFREKELGGFVGDDFIQYNTGSHASGNDQMVTANGTPGVGESTVQNKENAYKGYVMSDVLKNPETGNTFNVDAAKINKQHKDARFYSDQKNALDFKMSKLQMLNDALRTVETKKQKGSGGPLGQAMSNVPWMDIKNEFDRFNKENIQPGQTDGYAQDPTAVISNPELTLGQTGSRSSSNVSRPYTPSQSRSTDNGNYGIDSRTLNGLGLLAKSFSLAGSINDALATPQQEDVILPDYKQSDAYMKSANVDYTQARQDALGVSNIAANTNRSLSSNPGQFQGREQARLANLQDALGRVDMQQSNAQSNLNLQLGQYEQGKAQTNAELLYRNQQNNQMNEANSRLFDRSLASDLASIGTQFNNNANQLKAIQNNNDLSKFNNSQIIMYLNNKYPNVKVTPDIIEKLKAGKSIDEILKVNFE